MEDLVKYIKERLDEVEESYDFYLYRLDESYDPSEQKQFENRLRDLRVEKNVLKDILEQIEGEE